MQIVAIVSSKGGVGKRIKSFCGAKPTQKVRWTNAEVEVWAGLYEDFTADAWRLD